MRGSFELRAQSGSRLILFLLATLAAATSSGAADVVAPDTSFRFGRVLTGVVLEHDFILTNEGTAPLRVSRVQLTAPLVVARMPKSIAPGATAQIRVRMDTSGMRGRFGGDVEVVLNDAASTVSFRVEGEIVPLVEISPAPAFFIAARRGESREAALDIVNHEPEPLRIDDVSHPQDRFTTTLETVEAGRRYRLTLRLKPDGPGGRHSESIILRTSSRSAPTVTVAANTYLRERVYTFPDEVDFGTLSLSSLERDPGLLQGVAQTLMIYQFGGTGFSVRAGTTLAQVAIRSERGPQGDRYQSTVTLVPGQVRTGEIRGTILIETNDAQFPQLIVPVSGTILP